MALRIRKDGSILCAAIHSKEDGDTYIDDDLHYTMSVLKGVIVAEYWEEHKKTGQWWWSCNYPKDKVLDLTFVREPLKYKQMIDCYSPHEIIEFTTHKDIRKL